MTPLDLPLVCLTKIKKYFLPTVAVCYDYTSLKSIFNVLKNSCAIAYTVNPESFGVKIFSDTSKNPKIKNTKIFRWYILIAKRAKAVWISFVENVRQQLLLSWWQLSINPPCFEAHSRTAPPPIAGSHISLNIWFPRIHDSLYSSSIIFHVVANSSNFFPRLEFIGVFNFQTDARIRKYFYPKISYTKNFGHENFRIYGTCFQWRILTCW